MRFVWYSGCIIVCCVLTGSLSFAVNIAQVCSDQLFNVINDVLEHSKLEESKITLEYAPMSLYQILEDSLQVIVLQANTQDAIHKHG